MFNVAEVDRSVAALLHRQLVKANRSIQLSLLFGNIPKVVEGKWIGGIVEISFVEESGGLVIVVLFNCLHAFAIQALHNRQAGVPWNRDLDRGLCGSRNHAQTNEQRQNMLKFEMPVEHLDPALFAFLRQNRSTTQEIDLSLPIALMT